MSATDPTRTRSEPGIPATPGRIPLSVPEIGGHEWEYVKECLDTGWVSSAGPQVERFERDIASRLGARHAVAVVNGTAALHVALRIAGVRPDDEVLISTLTFVAPANAVRYVGAWPVFVDAEPRHGQMAVDLVVEFLQRDCRREGADVVNRATGRRVSAILPVHVLGHPIDLDRLVETARRHGLRVIEDATESLGSVYGGRPVGRPSDLACLSFNGNKIITTGGGGMILTNDSALAREARYLTTQAKDDPVEGIHGSIGYNYRLSNVAAAIGCAQLERLDEFVAKKRAIAQRYRGAFSAVSGLSMLEEPQGSVSNYWLTTVVVDDAAFGIDRYALLQILDESGIESRPPWQPLHRSPAHEGSRALSTGVADRLHRDGLSLPSSVGLSIADQERVTAAVLSAPARAGLRTRAEIPSTGSTPR